MGCRVQDAKFKNFTFIQQDYQLTHQLLSLDLPPHPFPSCKCLAILQDSTVISTSFASLLVGMD